MTRPPAARPPDARPPDARPPDARPPDARPRAARPPVAGSTAVGLPERVLQPTLFGGGAPSIDTAMVTATRTELAGGAWIERVPGWVQGEATLYDDLVAGTRWHEVHRPMYDRIVAVPRRTATLPTDGPVPPVLHDISGALAARHGEPFDRIGLAHYRDGADSVAPHGDQVARNLHTTTMAIVAVGAARRFVLSPTPALRAAVPEAATVSFDLGRGDAVVLGGTIQRTWRHGVPKTTRPVGPRLAIMFRPPWMT